MKDGEVGKWELGWSWVSGWYCGSSLFITPYSGPRKKSLPPPSLSLLSLPVLAIVEGWREYEVLGAGTWSLRAKVNGWRRHPSAFQVTSRWHSWVVNATSACQVVYMFSKVRGAAWDWLQEMSAPKFPFPLLSEVLAALSDHIQGPMILNRSSLFNQLRNYVEREGISPSLNWSHFSLVKLPSLKYSDWFPCL